MAEPVVPSPALALVVELETDGFVMQVTEQGTLTVKPGSKLSALQREQLVQYQSEVIVILGQSDPGVRARRDVFRRQLEAAAAPRVPLLVFVPDVPYAAFVCFSCGAPHRPQTFGRCWRCSLAWRLATGVLTVPGASPVRDEAKIA